MKRWSWYAVIGITLVYAVYWSWFTIGRHHTTNSTRFDLGNAEQVVWNASQGRFFRSTDPYGTSEVSRLAYHADFFLIALAPIYAIAPQTETLLILQTLALASAILAVWLLARTWLKHPGWAVVLAAAFAITPGLHWLNAFDFHAVAFAVPLVLWMMVAAVGKRHGWMFGFAILAMLTKEEIGLSLLPLAAWLWWRAKQRRWAAAMFIPAVWAMVMLLWAIPQAQTQIANAKNVFHSQFGNSAGEVIKNLATHPGSLAGTLVAPTSRQYGVQLLAPFGFVPLGHWLVTGAIPDGLINVVSGKDSQRTIFHHYQAGLLPWLMIATVAFVAWIRQRWPTRPWAVGFVVWVVAWSIVGAWLYGPLPGAKQDYSRVVRWHNPYAQPVRDWAIKIPGAAAVSVTNNIGAHFARRQSFYSFPRGINQADFIIVLEGHQTPEVTTQADVHRVVGGLKQNPLWRVRYQQNELTVLQRQPAS